MSGGINGLANLMQGILADQKKSVAMVGIIQGTTVVTNSGTYPFDVKVNIPTDEGDFVTIILDESGRAQVIGIG